LPARSSTRAATRRSWTSLEGGDGPGRSVGGLDRVAGAELRDGDAKRYAGKGVWSDRPHRARDRAGDHRHRAVNQVFLDETMKTWTAPRTKPSWVPTRCWRCRWPQRAAADLLGMPLYRYLGGTNTKLLPCRCSTF
jgi:enolase